MCTAVGTSIPAPGGEASFGATVVAGNVIGGPEIALVVGAPAGLNLCCAPSCRLPCLPPIRIRPCRRWRACASPSIAWVATMGLRSRCRPAAASSMLTRRPIWWTDWGVNPRWAITGIPASTSRRITGAWLTPPG